MQRVDSHAHVFALNEGIIASARYAPRAAATCKAYLCHLDDYNFDYGVLIQPSFLGDDNRQMLAAIRQHPQRLRGVAVVSADVGTAELERLNDGGIVGIRLNLFGANLPDLTSPRWQALLTTLEKLGWQVEVHGPLTDLLHVLEQLAAYRIPVVIDHFGRPAPDAAIDGATYGRFLHLLNPAQHWVKVSGYYRLGGGELGREKARQALTALLTMGMQDRLIWGSDWPHTQHSDMSYAAAVDFMKCLLADLELRKKVLGANALSLFRLTP